MKTNNSKLILVVTGLFLFIATTQIKAQDRLRPVSSTIPINPAYTGDNEHTTLHIYSRCQWQKGPNSNSRSGYLNQSYSTIIDGPVKGNQNFGWGIQITSRIGDCVESTAEKSTIGTKHLWHLTGSWKIPVNTTARLNIGISTGIAYKQKLNDTSSLKNKISPDLRFGLYYKESNWFASASIVNLTRNTDYGNSFYFSSGGTILHMPNDITLSSGIDFQANFDKKNEKSVRSFRLLERDNTEFSINTSVGIHKKYSFSVAYGQKFNNKGQSISLASNFKINETVKLSTTYGFGFEKYGLEQSAFGIAFTSFIM